MRARGDGIRAHSALVESYKMACCSDVTSISRDLEVKAFKIYQVHKCAMHGAGGGGGAVLRR